MICRIEDGTFTDPLRGPCPRGPRLVHRVLQEPTECIEVATPPVDPITSRASKELIVILAGPRRQLRDDVRLRDRAHQGIAPETPAERPDGSREVEAAEHLGQL